MEQQQQWIDFKELRAKLDFAAVLDYYRVELRPKGKDQLVGFCPLPRHNGQRKSPSFSVNLARKCFQCFGCQAKGNALEFCCYMEGKDPDDRRDIRAVALLLRDRFSIECSRKHQLPVRGAAPNQRQTEPSPRKESPPDRSPPKRPTPEDRPRENAGRANAHPADKVVVNAPLDFQLRGLDPHHPYLKERGFTAETIGHFGLGYCNRGLMQGRVVIPLKDQAGTLIGYAGRYTRDDQVSDKVPKYLFPGDRERNGTKLVFRKSHFLYNGDAIGVPVRDLLVVEGFPSVWWLTQCGFDHAVALMGSSCSHEQAELIFHLVSPSGRVWLMPDAGEAGERCADSVLRQVAPRRFVRWVKLDQGQPTDLSPDALVNILEWKVLP